MKRDSKTVVLYGRPLVGKVTLASAFARPRATELEVFDIPIPEHPGMADRGVRYRVNGTAIETMSGGVFNQDAWLLLLERASAIAFVAAGNGSIDDLHDMFATLPALPSVGCVIVTRGDVVDGAELADAARRVLSARDLSHWEVFQTRIDRPLQHVAPLEWLVSQVS